MLSVGLFAAGVHFSRAAIARNTPLAVSFLHQTTVFVLFFLLGTLWRVAGWKVAELHAVRLSALSACVRSNARFFLPASLLLALNGWLVNTSLGLYGAEMTSFLMNLTLVFLVLAGCAAGERLSAKEGLAIALMVGGAFLFSYRSGGVAWGAVGLMAAACAIVAGKQLLVKHISGHEPLPVVMAAVMALSVPWVFSLMVTGRQWQPPDLRTSAYVLMGAMLTSVAAMTLLYRAYHLVGVARGAPFNALRPLAVMLAGLAIGHALPTGAQVAGGVMILLGSVGLTLWHKAPGARAVQVAKPTPPLLAEVSKKSEMGAV